MYRRHTSLQCVVIAQETVAQNGQAEGCVFLLAQLYRYLFSPWIARNCDGVKERY